jgi:hypothetical protein
MANEPGQPSTYQGYIGKEFNIDITALRDKKISWKIVLNEISSDHNIIELNLDTNIDWRQAKLKRLSCNLRKADWELCEELIGTIESLE